jgi:hypothetical protein
MKPAKLNVLSRERPLHVGLFCILKGVGSDVSTSEHPGYSLLVWRKPVLVLSRGRG